MTTAQKKGRLLYIMKRLIFFFFTAFLFTLFSFGQKVIQLYNGKPAGSEKWTWKEKEVKVDIGRIVFDVSEPSLTIYTPSKPNGTAVIVAPGGAFHALAFD